ncbi:zinc ribbon domain-containing protein [Lacrimispora sp. NSJ-141]|uniref:Zinc ribbon domain-containing protein n=2 Tax=Lientehia hominis TaxID=2897778 RepID=A0AAP2W9Y4_9FIRM|nr:zinc ribbon domain-containing protein [Lientehia hominis]
MQGVSGTSKTGRKYYYYYCKAQREKACSKKKVRKNWLEQIVMQLLKLVLSDDENLASIAVDSADYYNKNYRDTGYLEGLEAKRREVER